MIRKSSKIRDNAFYAKAFYEDFNVLWENSPFKSAADIVLKCYFRAITCFLGTDADDEYDRRLLLYHFLKQETEEEYLDEKFPTLPLSDNLFKKIARNVFSAYSEPAQRKFSENETVNEKFAKYYQNSGAHSAFKQAYKTAGFTNVVAVRPKHVFKKSLGKKVTEHEVLTPDMFSVEVSDTDPNDVVSIAIPYQAGELTLMRIWTAETVTVKNLKGETVRSEVNKYGRIPYTFLKLTDGKEFYGGGDITLVQAQLYSNKLRLHADESETYSALAIWIGTNLKGDANGKFKISPRKVINFADVKNPDMGQHLPPELESKTAQPFFTEINDFRKSIDDEELRTRELPEDVITGDKPLNGVSRLIAQQGLTEARQEHIDRLRTFERQYAELFALVLNKDAAENFPEDLEDFQVDFAEPRWFLELKDEYEFDTTKMSVGLISPSEFVKKWAGIDGEMTDKDAIKYMMNHKALFKSLEAGVTPENNGEKSGIAATETVG